MDSNITSLLEDILGIEKAKACIQEIEARIHPEDSGKIKAQLIKKILHRDIENRVQFIKGISCWDIENCDLSMRDLVSLVKRYDSKYLLIQLTDALTFKVYHDIKDDYKAKEPIKGVL